MKIQFNQIDGAAYNVKDYGALGDGVTDDTTAIAAALAAVKLTQGILYFPPGDYVHTTGISLNQNFGITVRGAGVYLSAVLGTRLNYTGTGVAVQIDYSGFDTVEDLTIHGTAAAAGGLLHGDGASVGSKNITRNVEIDGFTAVGGYGFKVVSSIRNYAENVKVSGCYNGLVIDGATADNTEWHTCQFLSNANYGIYIHNGYSHSFFNCNVESNTNEGLYISAKGNLAALENVDNIVFHNLWIEANNSGGTAEIFISSDVAAADTREITFYNLHARTTPVASYYLEISAATNVRLVYPDLISWSYISVLAGALETSAITNTITASWAGNGKMHIHYTGIQTQSLAANDTTPTVFLNGATYGAYNTAGTVISQFDGNVFDGFRFTLIITEANTSVPNGANIITKGAVTISGAGATASFVYNATLGKWYEY